MSQLRALQEAVQTFLTKGDESVCEWIEFPKRGSVLDRIHIYGDAYHLRLVDKLKKDFPTIEKLLGEKSFHKLALAYIASFPSKHFSVNEFGKYFGTFLKDKKPHLSELAELEWALSSVITAPDAPILTQEALKSIPLENWPALRFKLHPSVILLEHEWDSLSNWKKVLENKLSLDMIKKSEKTYCVLWRKNQETYYFALTKPQFETLKLFSEAKTFEAVCDTLAQIMPEETVANFVVQTITFCINESILAEIEK